MHDLKYGPSSQKMHWNIAGGIRFNDLISRHLDSVNGAGHITVYDSYHVSWSGGRNTADRHYERSHLEKLVEHYKEKGIGLFFTFSNHIMTTRHLADEVCNEILSIAHVPGNGVIVTCEFLAEYIRENYPLYTVTYSVINSYIDEVILWPEDMIVEYYTKMSESYDIVVIAPEFNRRLDLVRKLPVESIEVLVNEQCASFCPHKNNHYLHEAAKKPDPWAVPCPKDKGDLVLSREEIDTLCAYGVFRFKIQGRTYTTERFSEILTTYL